MRYLLDTNAISDAVERPIGNVATRIRQLSDTASIVTSIIAVSELRYGYTKISSRRLKEAYDAFFESIQIESWEKPFDYIYGDLRSELERRGKTLGAMDMLIAVHALATDAVVVSDDRAYSQVPGLITENWLRDTTAGRE